MDGKELLLECILPEARRAGETRRVASRATLVIRCAKLEPLSSLVRLEIHCIAMLAPVCAPSAKSDMVFHTEIAFIMR